ncbi:uncharacterized protein TORIP [Euwallacea similis]|uniref:uncharacterized protein TORIP n=1 Tax=Euwallacea similis TaxID=1736056 RepID=UPI00344B9352
MGIDRPGASSTPTSVRFVKGRKGLRDESSIESPIPHVEKDNQCNYLSYSPHLEGKSLSPSSAPAKIRQRNFPRRNTTDSDSESESNLSDEDSPQISNNSDHLNESNSLQLQKNSSHTKTIPDGTHIKQYIIPTVWITVLVIITLLYSPGILEVFVRFALGNPEPNRTTQEELINKFKHMEGQFTHQEEDFWRRIRLNIEEIRYRHKPSTIIFLYENNHKSESTMKRILNNIKSVAVCHLTDCDKVPIEIQGSALNSLEIIADYGKVISQYRNFLVNSGVMIVEHLEEVPGQVARAFHHFCDENNPLVSNALLLFTVKVDKLPDDEESDSYLKKTLMLLWNDIGRDDKFEPLYARISGTILVVRPE